MSQSQYFSDRIGWLRAAVLGANDSIVSTSSLVVGIAAANTGRTELLLASVAELDRDLICDYVQDLAR